MIIDLQSRKLFVKTDQAHFQSFKGGWKTFWSLKDICKTIWSSFDIEKIVGITEFDSKRSTLMCKFGISGFIFYPVTD